MLTKRSSHGCNRVAMNNSEYIVIFGGYNGTGYTSDIHFLNLATRKWETYPDKIVLPEKPVSIYGSIVLRLDKTGCEMMLVGLAVTVNYRAYIWSGGELLEMRLLDKKWNRSFFYLPYVYQYLT